MNLPHTEKTRELKRKDDELPALYLMAAITLPKAPKILASLVKPGISIDELLNFHGQVGFERTIDAMTTFLKEYKYCTIDHPNTHGPDPKAQSDQLYREFWKDIVERPDGTLDLEKVKGELYDYHMLLENSAEVYAHVTGGMVSKQNTLPGVVCDLADDDVEKHVEEVLGELRDELMPIIQDLKEEAKNVIPTKCKFSVEKKCACANCRLDDLNTVLDDHCTPCVVPLPHQVAEEQEAPKSTPHDTSGSRGEPETPA
jgi:hypothetical protein